MPQLAVKYVKGSVLWQLVRPGGESRRSGKLEGFRHGT